MTFGLTGENFRSARCARGLKHVFGLTKVGENLESAAEIAKNAVKKARIAQNFFGLDS